MTSGARRPFSVCPRLPVVGAVEDVVDGSEEGVKVGVPGRSQ